MSRNPSTLFFFFLFIASTSFAQTDEYAGTWRMKPLPQQGFGTVNMELQIASSESRILYPAHLKLQCDSFSAEYELLLVKKDSRQLAISRNKFPESEKPFGLGEWLIFLNGVLDYSRDLNGVPTLNIIRIPSKQLHSLNTDTIHLTKAGKATAMRLKSFLKDDDIQLIKVNDSPWDVESRDSILSPHISPAYFGLLDTVHVQQRDGSLSLASNKKKDGDIVSLALNGRTDIDQLSLNKKAYNDDILLDTGLNILVLFADNFADGLPNKGRLNLAFANKKLSFGFEDKADSAATFIAAKIYYDHDTSQDTGFPNYMPQGKEDVLQKNEKLLSSIVSTSQELTFAIWDDAIEDGDSISININGKWLVHGFPVKTKPQFLKVTLQPGPNIITYIGDNVGSIPPNTSVLEIIDGRKRKSFSIETNPGDNNLIRIFYDTGKGL